MGDLDRRKHDVDVIERVVSGVRDRLQDDGAPAQVVDVGPGSGTDHLMLELTIGVADDRPPRGDDVWNRPPHRSRS